MESEAPLTTLDKAAPPPPAKPAPRDAAMIAAVIRTCARICAACLLMPRLSSPLASFSTILSITPVSLSTWHAIAMPAPITGPTASPPVATHATTAATTARAVISQPKILLAFLDSAALSMSLRDFSIFSERPWRSVSRASFWRLMRSFAIWAWRSSLSIWRYEMSFSRFSSSCLMSAGLSSAGMFVAPVGLPVSFVELTFDVTFTLRLDIIAATSLIVCVVFSESPRPFVRSDI